MAALIRLLLLIRMMVWRLVVQFEPCLYDVAAERLRKAQALAELFRVVAVGEDRVVESLKCMISRREGPTRHHS
jgi:hypothetical protein